MKRTKKSPKKAKPSTSKLGKRVSTLQREDFNQTAARILKQATDR